MGASRCVPTPSQREHANGRPPGSVNLGLPSNGKMRRDEPSANVNDGWRAANLVAQIKDIGLFQVPYIDFTELLYIDGHRKAILIAIILKWYNSWGEPHPVLASPLTVPDLPPI